VLGHQDVLGDVDQQLRLVEHLMGEVNRHTGGGKGARMKQGEVDGHTTCKGAWGPKCAW
jgi:hypothetical protein